MADHSKFGKVSLAQVDHLDNVDQIITDNKILDSTFKK